MRRQLAFFILIIISGCIAKQTFEDESGRYKLNLLADSTYSLKFPTFFGSHAENGSYKIIRDSILLKYNTETPHDSIIDCVTSYMIDYPDTVEFLFKNLNDSSICVNFAINNNPTIFKTDKSGHLKLLYRDLTLNKIILNDSSFYFINISYNNKNYAIKESSMHDIHKPTTIEIILNQFVGKKTAIMYEKYAYSNDSIILNTKDFKGMPKDVRLVRKH